MIAVDVDPQVFALRPDYVALVLVVRGIGNGPTDAQSESALSGAEAALRATGLARAADHPHIAAWRSAFSAFGAKPSKYLSSAEALMARVLKGGELPRINALVDLYNAVSVRHVIPVGGEDADRLDGTLRLTIADGSEAFDARDDGAAGEPVRPGEVVWRDDTAVTCRRWNWRQGARTQLTEAAQSAFFVFDRLDGLPLAALHAAADDLERTLRERRPGIEVERIVRAP